MSENWKMIGAFGLVLIMGMVAASSGMGNFKNLMAKGNISQVKMPTPTFMPTVVPTTNPKATTTIKPTGQVAGLRENCSEVKVLMYHHIQPDNLAKAKGQEGLTVSPENFKKQLKKLIDDGNSFVTPSEVVNFLDGKGLLPSKPVMITIDDGYDDNYTYAFPILKELNAKATIFLATGLMDNLQYMSWKQVEEMKASGLVHFGNHTWSHMAANADEGKLKEEIETAQRQLNEKGLNNPPVFAYPYGNPSANAKRILNEVGMKLAFTTYDGTTMCPSARMELPRRRMGNI